MHELRRRNGKKHLVTSALPYVNNEPHLGNLLQVLSADVYARFSRLKGYETLYICGTDEYGTATEMKALETGVSEYKLCSEYHALHSSIYSWFNVSFDIFSRTSEAVHTGFTQEMFKRAYRNGCIAKVNERQFYCAKCARFISDRFVRGECPECGAETNADQCDSCGSLIDAEKLKNPRCGICSSRVMLRDTENLALDMPKLKDKLEKFVESAQREKRWPSNAVGIAKSWLKDGLRKRTITRDLKWGIKVPLRGFDNKVFYVWFDACIGYISLTAMRVENWRDWWMKPDEVELTQFIGKDNIPFHALIFPATEMATGFPFTMLHRLNSSEYLTFEGGKFSKSQGIGVFGSDCMDAGYSSDVWRFYLYFNRPEKGDSDFSFDDFQEKVNAQLVGNFSNLVNRAFVFLEKQYGSMVPRFGVDQEFYGRVREKIVKIDDLYEGAQIKDTLHEILSLSDMLNKYFQESEPWKLINSDPGKCGRVMRTIMLGVKDLCLLLFPYIPEAAGKMARAMSLDPSWSLLGEETPFDKAIKPIGYLFERISDDAIRAAKRKFCSSSAIVPVKLEKATLREDKRRAKANAAPQASAKVESEAKVANVRSDRETEAKAVPETKPNAETKPVSEMKAVPETKPDEEAKPDARKKGALSVKDFRLEGESYAEAFRRRVNVKVSRITDVKRHPEGDRLYVLTLDAGEPEPRTIVSSIAPFYSEEELIGHNILLVANLKPAKFRGVKSFGMLLAASEKDDVSHSTCEVLFADGAQVGENVYPEGTASQSDYAAYLKPEHFFSIPLASHNGQVEVDGARLVTDKTGIAITCEKYGNGNIG